MAAAADVRGCIIHEQFEKCGLCGSGAGGGGAVAIHKEAQCCGLPPHIDTHTHRRSSLARICAAAVAAAKGEKEIVVVVVVVGAFVGLSM